MEKTNEENQKIIDESNQLWNKVVDICEGYSHIRSCVVIACLSIELSKILGVDKEEYLLRMGRTWDTMEKSDS